MKRGIVFFLYALTVIYISAADYLSRSFRWEVNISLEDGIHQTSTITIGKDTVINNNTYRLVNNYHPMRQLSDSILWYDRIAQKEILLYNFALQEGDSIELIEDPFGGFPTRYAKVAKTGIITLADGRQARKIEYEQKYPAPRETDIEYVGSLNGGILGVLNNSISEYQLIAFYDDDELVYTNQKTTQQLLGEWQVYRERVTGTMWDNEGMPYTGSYTHDVNMRMLYVFTPDFEYELQMDEASGVVHYSDTRSYTIEPLTADTWLLTINGAFDTPKPSDPAISGRSPITIYKITENEIEWEYTYYSGDEGSMTYYQYVRRYQSDEQGVENVLSTSSARKILRNNQILILRGDKTYTLTGQQLK